MDYLELVALILFLIGFYKLVYVIRYKDLHNACKEQIQATLIGINIITKEESPTSYRPIYKYSYKAITYKNEASLPFKRIDYSKVEVGSTYSIYIDPESPETCIPYKLSEKECRRKLVTAFILMLLPFVLLAVGAFVKQLLL